MWLAIFAVFALTVPAEVLGSDRLLLNFLVPTLTVLMIADFLPDRD